MKPRVLERIDQHTVFVVRREFKLAGRNWKPDGEIFDWRKCAINFRKVRQLFEMGKLDIHPNYTDESTNWGHPRADEDGGDGGGGDSGSGGGDDTSSGGDGGDGEAGDDTLGGGDGAEAEVDIDISIDPLTITSMAELRALADKEGAKRKATIVLIQQSIIQNRIDRGYVTP